MMDKRSSDAIMFRHFVLPNMARAIREWMPDDEQARESALWSEIAASPYAYLVPALGSDGS